MKNDAISPLQMRDWRIGELKVSNSIIFPNNDIPHKWTIKATMEHLKPIDNKLRATIFVEFTFAAEQDDRKDTIEGIAASYFEFDKEVASVDDPESLFDQLLHNSAMTNMFGNLRVFLLQSGVLFQIGPKRIMLPFINLHEFAFDKKYTYIV